MRTIDRADLIAMLRAILDDDNLVITRANDASFPLDGKGLDAVLELMATLVAVDAIDATQTEAL